MTPLVRTTPERNEQLEAAAFDRLAESFDRTRLKTSAWTFSRYRRAVLGRPLFDAYPDLVFKCLGTRLVSPQDPEKPLQGLTVLDLGAGDGEWSVILAQMGARVLSVEIAPKQVELARERMTINGLTWEARVGSAYRLQDQFPEASFDLVFGQGILHHLTADLRRVYSGINYVLRTGGYALFGEPYSGSSLLRQLREGLAWAIPIDRESPEERPLRPSDLAPMQEYFASVEVRYHDLFAKFGRRIFRSASLARYLVRVDNMMLASAGFRRFATALFIVVIK